MPAAYCLEEVSTPRTYPTRGKSATTMARRGSCVKKFYGFSRVVRGETGIFATFRQALAFFLDLEGPGGEGNHIWAYIY
jgi:hypothetical protein